METEHWQRPALKQRRPAPIHQIDFGLWPDCFSSAGQQSQTPEEAAALGCFTGKRKNTVDEYLAASMVRISSSSSSACAGTCSFCQSIGLLLLKLRRFMTHRAAPVLHIADYSLCVTDCDLYNTNVRLATRPCQHASMTAAACITCKL